MSKKFMPNDPVPPWRVGVWVSSADPRKHVVMVAVGEEEIAEYGAHRDFVRWLTPNPLEVGRPSMSLFLTAADYNAAMDEWLAASPGPMGGGKGGKQE